ncbi:MAG: rRNA adenine N-6-methyltransferase family protein [Candidatus Nanoarchaeia archaeon]|nr:rRNA adenine N-6-methyltransferase family protein [Candidatus Nanoarchaeia archaeon]
MEKKNLDKGQHFLIDEEVLKKEIHIANLSKTDKVIEIGAGEGVLTKELVKQCEVLAFEIDKRYSSLNQINNAKIVFDDALKHSWKGYKIVSNIPYHLSDQIMKKAIIEDIEELILIVGENFKENLEENKSTISLISNICYKIKFEQKVLKKSFSPPPRVDSWLISFKKRKLSIIEDILVSVFKHKGKIKNALINSFKGKTKNQAREIMSYLNLNQKSLETSTSKITPKLLLRLKESLESMKTSL